MIAAIRVSMAATEFGMIVGGALILGFIIGCGFMILIDRKLDR